ncbi:MAG: coniferyl aldehyde dehydrogenase [Rubrivivax sp.]|nr:coniferyl aldehyde dehydrogenase [Rubrivivax sp.]
MSAVLQDAPAATSPTLRAAFEAQRAAFEAERDPSYAVRLERLARLQAMVERMAPAMIKAISADFGHRPAQVTQISDVMPVLAALRHTRRHLRGWMKTRRAPTPLIYRPGRSEVMRQPIGVVGVVSPWNYPGNLALAPAVAALAAGNRVLIKPSELTPRFAELLRAEVAQSFSPGELAVITGDADVGRAFVALPFDHLLFTGSTAVGRHVALAAAANLTPVTLELGGKSPAILNPDCDLARAVPSLLMGKLLNAGQTCIAPDYVAVPRPLLDAFVAAMKAGTQRMYPAIASNPDYTSIVSARHFARLQALVDDARERGATVVPLHTEVLTDTSQRKLPPLLLLNASDEMKVMQEEIFGPLLPVLVYDSLDEVIAYVNRHDRPLALYWFGRSDADRDRVLRQTLAGGVTINDTLLHIAQEDLPFGGIGASGSGAYHGEWGFRTFSKETGVFHQPALNGVSLMYPPYGAMFERMLGWLRRLG